MQEHKLFDAEYKMMDLIWQHEPIPSPELIQMCEERFGWKKSTTFTQIRRMVDRGFVKNEKTILTTLVKRSQVEQYDSEEVVDGRFGGSLPKFVTAFMESKRMTQEDIDELRRILDSYEGE